ncbi:MAG TPA: hypothetical protein VJ949_13555, partial [Cryomorphaceae bacterium]|nr:hypothetical protein [Cryomorphaceae bacterium]
MKRIILFISLACTISAFSQDRRSMRFIEDAREATTPYLKGQESYKESEKGDNSAVILDKIFVGNYEGKQGKIQSLTYER